MAKPSTRRKSQIWLQIKEDFLESCYVLATSKNSMSEYGNFHVFLLRMWQTKRHKKGILQPWEARKKKNGVV
jgi:hypothetical protein